MAMRERVFASDNYAGMCPEAWGAMEKANGGHVVSYGDDEWTAKAADLIREVFETKCEVFFVFNGTAANSLALAHLCQSYHSILCHELSHVETDECGAPEFFSHGTKLLQVSGENGKMEPGGIEKAVRKRTDIHYPKPRAVTITEATEVGTVYSVGEIRAITQTAKMLGLKVHMDGARFANAVVATGARAGDLTWRAGVDVLSFGGTKNGGGVGEAVVFFDRGVAEEFEFRCKQAGQLASKMRMLAAPWVGMLTDGAWLKHARHANEMAGLMEELLRGVEGARVLFAREANSVFVELPEGVIRELHERGWKFYTFIGKGGCRLMCSWDTREEDVREFVGELAKLMG
ncbi:MAG: low specificity L-threonine aldolase [Planctomycetota bacterium]|nr:low specificity L-threonine aldolase [Planctomycetota bacterium]